ncbi:MAG TPA: exosortase/archaeosortase family protein [Nitrospirota bacterium]
MHADKSFIQKMDRNLFFLLFNIMFAAAFFSPLLDLVRTAWASEYYTYIPFIPFISAFLMYENRQTIFSQKTSSHAAGLILTGIGLSLLFVGETRKISLGHSDYLALTTFALATLWIGGVALCFGAGSLRSASFPFLFLFFMVPVPDAVLEKIIFFLQSGSAEVSYLFFQAAGIPVARDGFVFHLPMMDIEVAKQCSGIRSSLSLVITGFLAAYLFLRTGWARALLMILLVPVAVVKNGIRIFVLSMLGVYWDRGILDSDLHRKGGFVFFILALVLAGAGIVLLRKMEKKPPKIREKES